MTGRYDDPDASSRVELMSASVQRTITVGRLDDWLKVVKVRDGILLLAHFPDFRRAFSEDGLTVEEFDSYGPTRRTLRQFIGACGDLDALVRDLMIPNPDRAQA
jgi:hypothetical protein